MSHVRTSQVTKLSMSCQHVYELEVDEPIGNEDEEEEREGREKDRVRHRTRERAQETHTCTHTHKHKQPRTRTRTHPRRAQTKPRSSVARRRIAMDGRSTAGQIAACSE